MTSTLEIATLGAGCYWCTEAVFQRIRGVEDVVSGFMGGHVDAPSYEAVCQGTTGHAEVIQLHFDPLSVTYGELLEVFWKTHDPTTLNRQGADVGTQYRSVVFVHSPLQRRTAESYRNRLNDENLFGKPVVTEITPASTFYPAPTVHQNYYNQHPHQGYCGYVIRPKLDKLTQFFSAKLKDDPSA